VFISISGRSGAGELSVTGNAIHGTGSPHETGLAYSLGDAASMTVTSTGNQVGNVGAIRSVGAGVTVTAGQ
jgi:hypothetical protein